MQCDVMSCTRGKTAGELHTARDGLEVDGLLVADDELATSAVAGAVAVVPLRRAADLLLRLGSDDLLRRQVAAVLVLEGADHVEKALRSCSAVHVY